MFPTPQRPAWQLGVGRLRAFGGILCRPVRSDERIWMVSNVLAYLSKVQNTDGPFFRGLARGQKLIKASTLSSIVRDQILGPDGAAMIAWVKK